MPATNLNSCGLALPYDAQSKLPTTVSADGVQKTPMASQIGAHSAGESRSSKPRSPWRPNVSTSTDFRRDIGSRFGLRVRALRRSHGMTQMDMAIDFGIDRSYISDFECGKKGISLATLEVIALGFKMELSNLFEDL